MSFCASAQVRKEFPVKWEVGAWISPQMLGAADGQLSVKRGDINLYIDKTEGPCFIQKMFVYYEVGGAWVEYNWKYPWSFQAICLFA